MITRGKLNIKCLVEQFRDWKQGVKEEESKPYSQKCSFQFADTHERQNGDNENDCRNNEKYYSSDIGN